MKWSRRRKVLAAVLGVFLVAFAWVSYEVLAVYDAEPAPTVDSRAALRTLALDGAGVTAEQADAAWTLLAGIFGTVDEVEAEINAMYDAGEFAPRDEYDMMLDYSYVRRGRTLPADLEPERLALAMLDERGVFEQLRRFAAGPPGLRPITGEGPLGIGDLLGDLSRARSLAMLEASRMRLAAAAGDYAGAAASFDHVLALARTIAWQPFLISCLTATAIETLALEELKYEFIELSFDEAACRAVLESLDRHEAAPDILYPLRAERVFAHDWLQWSYSDDGAGDGYLVSAPAPDLAGPPPKQSLLGAAIARFFHQTRAEATDALDDFFDQLLVAGEVGALEDDVILAGLEAAFDSFIGRRPRKLVRLAGTRAIVLVERHRAVHGAYPASLAELDGDVPADPLHGLPFGYTLPDDDPDGRGYLLYSVGLDASDNGGVEPDAATRDMLGWYAALDDPEAAGTDFVLNRPRRGGD